MTQCNRALECSPPYAVPYSMPALCSAAYRGCERCALLQLAVQLTVIMPPNLQVVSGCIMRRHHVCGHSTSCWMDENVLHDKRTQQSIDLITFACGRMLTAGKPPITDLSLKQLRSKTAQ